MCAFFTPIYEWVRRYYQTVLPFPGFFEMSPKQKTQKPWIAYYCVVCAETKELKIWKQRKSCCKKWRDEKRFFFFFGGENAKRAMFTLSHRRWQLYNKQEREPRVRSVNEIFSQYLACAVKIYKRQMFVGRHAACAKFAHIYFEILLMITRKWSRSVIGNEDPRIIHLMCVFCTHNDNTWNFPQFSGNEEKVKRFWVYVFWELMTSILVRKLLFRILSSKICRRDIHKR